MAKQRAVRIEQKSQLAAIQQLESRTDAELETETRYRAAAQAILGARAAQKLDPVKTRAHFQRAIAAAPPQERLPLRRMAETAMAQAERRAGDYKKAKERIGQPASGREVFMLRMLGMVAPPKSAGGLARARGIVIAVALVIAILLLCFGIVNLVSLPFGGISLDLGIFYGFVVLLLAIVVLAVVGRRRQRRAQAEQAERLAAARSR
jgi:uncharacterized integral membrane protein